MLAREDSTNERVTVSQSSTYTSVVPGTDVKTGFVCVLDVRARFFELYESTYLSVQKKARTVLGMC
jgi:hypothetical protein